MGIELNEPGGFLNMLGRILVGLVFVVGPIETVIVDGFEVRSQRQHETVTALQAHAAIADSMHVGLTSAVIRWAWLMLVQRLNVSLPVGQEILVHTACAGMVNAGFLAAERALKGLQLTAVLSVASEKCSLRRDALRMQYPNAMLVADAAMDVAYSRHSHIFIASWPCKTYSSAQVDSSVPRKVWEERAWYNTRLICYIVQQACLQPSGPPNIIVLENVKGLFARKRCRPYLKFILRFLTTTPHTWFNQVICPRIHLGAQCSRPRLFLVGIVRRGIGAERHEAQHQGA